MANYTRQNRCVDCGCLFNSIEETKDRCEKCDKKQEQNKMTEITKQQALDALSCVKNIENNGIMYDPIAVLIGFIESVDSVDLDVIKTKFIENFDKCYTFDDNDGGRIATKARTAIHGLLLEGIPDTLNTSGEAERRQRKRVDELAERNNELEFIVEDRDGEIIELQKQLAERDERISVLEKIKMKQERKLTEYEDRITELQESSETWYKTACAHNKNIVVLKQRISELEKVYLKSCEDRTLLGNEVDNMRGEICELESKLSELQKLNFEFIDHVELPTCIEAKQSALDMLSMLIDRKHLCDIIHLDDNKCFRVTDYGHRSNEDNIADMCDFKYAPEPKPGDIVMVEAEYKDRSEGGHFVHVIDYDGDEFTLNVSKIHRMKK